MLVAPPTTPEAGPHGSDRRKSYSRSTRPGGRACQHGCERRLGPRSHHAPARPDHPTNRRCRLHGARRCVDRTYNMGTMQRVIEHLHRRADLRSSDVVDPVTCTTCEDAT